MLSLTAYGIPPCGDSTDTMTITFQPNPTADAGPDATICENQIHILSGTATDHTSVQWTGGDGSFTNPTGLDGSYIPGPQDLASGSVILYLTAYGVCGSAIDSLTLSIIIGPTANAGLDDSIKFFRHKKSVLVSPLERVALYMEIDPTIKVEPVSFPIGPHIITLQLPGIRVLQSRWLPVRCRSFCRSSCCR